MAGLNIDPKKKLELLLGLKVVKRITSWDDIKIGGIYHMPPLVYNDRLDFEVIDKTENTLIIRKVGDGHNQRLFKTDITSNFIVKKWCCNEF